MKKIISVVGARPNFMKVAPLHRAFKQYDKEIKHLIVHTGQHYDKQMSDAFFADLDMPNPDFFLGIGSGSHAEQTGKVMIEFEKICIAEKPDLVIVVGDVNSTLAATITAVKLGIKLAHVESGLRSYDRSMPEEINRMATDAIADYCFVTEQSGYDNLIKEGFPKDKIFFCGNTMIDSLHYAIEKAESSSILEKLELTGKKYTLATLHRPSNVDEPEMLKSMVDLLCEFSEKSTIVFPIHPRTRKNLEVFGLNEKIRLYSNLVLTDPLGYVDFIALMRSAFLVMTDSGGIQEETTALKKSCLTLRTTTERPITCEIGANKLVIPTPENIRQAFYSAIDNPPVNPQIPPLWDGKAAERITEQIVKLLNK